MKPFLSSTECTNKLTGTEEPAADDDDDARKSAIVHGILEISYSKITLSKCTCKTNHVAVNDLLCSAATRSSKHCLHFKSTIVTRRALPGSSFVLVVCVIKLRLHIFHCISIKESGSCRAVLFGLSFFSSPNHKSRLPEPPSPFTLYLTSLLLNIMMNHKSNRITGWVSRKTVPRFMERINFYSFPSAAF